MGLQTFTKDTRNTHILFLSDNTTAVASVNKMGSVRSPECDGMARKIWYYAIPRNIWITASYLPGTENTEADYESRRNHIDNKEWMLDVDIFQQIKSTLGLSPCIDLFASRLNHQLKPYISFGPDPEAKLINAFTVDWG
mgnify:CR=1 FL=1